MQNHLISVIIDTYNYAQFIEEAIYSVLNQDFSQDKIEIIVVDDGSKDNTSERVKKFGDKIKYIYKENGGQASAFNLGFKHATGEIIAFLDADDLWHPAKLKIISQLFLKFPTVGMVCHNLKNIFVSESESEEVKDFLKNSYFGNSYRYTKINCRENILKSQGDFPATSGLSFRSNYLAKAMPIPTIFRICADVYLRMIVPIISDVITIDAFLGAHRIHGKNLYIGNTSKEKIQEQLKYAKNLKILIKDFCQRNNIILPQNYDIYWDNNEHVSYAAIGLVKKNRDFFTIPFLLGKYFKYTQTVYLKEENNFFKFLKANIAMLLYAILPWRVFKFLKNSYLKTKLKVKPNKVVNL